MIGLPSLQALDGAAGPRIWLAAEPADESWQLEYYPGHFERLHHVRKKYACAGCKSNGENPAIHAVKKPEAVIEKGLAGPGLLAYIVTSKFSDFLPLYRLEDIFARQGFEISRATGTARWLGHRDDICKLLGSASIFCLPTYYREGLPHVLVEASAAGLPIVTTDVPGCREVVTPGKNGLLVPPRNVDALADALQCLVENREIRSEMRIASRKIFEEKFTSDSVRAALNQCYAKLSIPIVLS